MAKIQPPFLELSFYYAEQEEHKSFSTLLEAVIAKEGIIGNTAQVHQGENIAMKPFASIRDEFLEDVNLADTSVEAIRKNANLRLIQVELDHTFNTASPHIPGILTFVSISQQASLVDQHPIGIWLDGTAFDPFPENDKLQKKAGKRAYQYFKMLVEATSPSYAAITIEYPLECPTDLRRDPRSLAFVDFYISEQYLGKSKLEQLLTFYDGAYIETLGDGRYISCSNYFNPKGETFEFNHHVEVSKLIASAK